MQKIKLTLQNVEKRLITVTKRVQGSVTLEVIILKLPVVGPVGAASLILIVINATTGMKPRRNGLGEVRMR